MELLLCVAEVCWKAGEPLVMEEVMVASPLADEVRNGIICTSLCHSDITFWKLKVRFTFRLLSYEGRIRRKYGRLFAWLWIVIDFYIQDPPSYFPRILGHEVVG